MRIMGPRAPQKQQTAPKSSFEAVCCRRGPLKSLFKRFSGIALSWGSTPIPKPLRVDLSKHGASRPTGVLPIPRGRFSLFACVALAGVFFRSSFWYYTACRRRFLKKATPKTFCGNCVSFIFCYICPKYSLWLALRSKTGNFNKEASRWSTLCVGLDVSLCGDSSSQSEARRGSTLFLYPDPMIPTPQQLHEARKFLVDRIFLHIVAHQPQFACLSFPQIQTLYLAVATPIRHFIVESGPYDQDAAYDFALARMTEELNYIT